MSEHIALNGEIFDSKSLRIECDSMGLAYGYGVFETIKIRENQPCFFSDHYSRLARSSNALGLDLGWSKEELLKQVETVVAENGESDGGLKILCYRGKRGTDVLIHMREVGADPTSHLALCVSNCIQSSRAVTSRFKTMNYLENLIQLRKAQEHGYDECIFLNEYECLTECCTANLFFVSDGTLRTPLVDCGLLEGVVRGKVMQIAEQKGMLLEEGRFRVEELADASEVFVTNSLRGIQSVDRIRFTGSNESSYERSLATVLDRYLSELERVEV